MEIKEKYSGIPYPLEKAQDEAQKIKKELNEFGFQEKGEEEANAQDIEEFSSLDTGVTREDLIDCSPEEILRMRDDELENLHAAILRELTKYEDAAGAGTTKDFKPLS